MYAHIGIGSDILESDTQSEAGIVQKTDTEAMVMEGEQSGSVSKQGSHFALQVALQTMKERCQQLQRRLTTMEDENIALRRMVARSGADQETSGPASLREQVAVLALQKAQMSQQMQMVAAENRQLWLRLSRLYQANQSLGSHLSRISDTLKQHASHTASTQDVEDTAASLEEISLKLANSIKQEKTALEQQCAEMTEIQNNPTLDLQTLAADDGDEALAIHYLRLLEVRDMLKGQQNALRVGVEALRCAKDETKTASESVIQDNESEEQQEREQLSTLRDWAVPDYTCPMCGNYFPSASFEFEVFHKHVMSHFASEDDDDAADTYDFC